MNPAILMAVVGAIGLGVAVALAFQPEHDALESVVLGRLEKYTGAAPPVVDQGGAAFWVNRVRRAVAEHDEAERGTRPRLDVLSDALSKADLDISPTEWRAAQILLAVIVFALTWLVVNIYVAVPVAMALPYFGGRFLLGFRQQRRIRRFDNQLGDVCVLLSNALRTGYSFAQALESVAAGARSPIKEEFSRAQRELTLGVPVDDALRRLVDRNPSEDLDLMVTAVQIQRVVGGNLAEILDTIAHTIRERVRIKAEIRTVTAQARVSGWIISLLPIGLAAVLSVIAPDYFVPMFHEFLGLGMLGIGVIMMAFGILVIRQIVTIKI